jgi:hypothetical protein
VGFQPGAAYIVQFDVVDDDANDRRNADEQREDLQDIDDDDPLAGFVLLGRGGR